MFIYARLTSPVYLSTVNFINVQLRHPLQINKRKRLKENWMNSQFFKLYFKFKKSTLSSYVFYFQ